MGYCMSKKNYKSFLIFVLLMAKVNTILSSKKYVLCMRKRVTFFPHTVYLFRLLDLQSST